VNWGNRVDDKTFISAQQLLEDSVRLGLQILASGYYPDFIVAIWRGGTPVGISIQELFTHFGIHTDHISIRTSAYEGIGRIGREIGVHGLGYIVKNAQSEHRLLLVDDVFDTGRSLEAALVSLRQKMRRNLPGDIRIATVYFKPGSNQTGLRPDFYLHETDRWLVFPHELTGLNPEELATHKPEILRLIGNFSLPKNQPKQSI